MSRWINSDLRNLQSLADIMDLVPTEKAICILECEGTEVICGALFDGYNGKTIHGHIWIAEGKQPSRLFWYAIYDYPFRQCGVTNLIGTVVSYNKKAQKLVEHLGFRLNSIVPNYYPNGADMMLYVCTVETAGRWEKIRPAGFIVKEQENVKPIREEAESA
jgi:RimJ/RimL family protein N-acetyltransferase